MKKRITAYHSHVQALREHAAKTTLGDLLVGAAPADFGRMLDELLEISYRQCVALLGYIAAPRLCRSFTVAGVPDTWTAMRLYCERRYPGHAALTAAHHLFELLAYLFQPAELRVRYGPGIALQNLERDRDDLVTGPKQLDYTKEGILDGNRWLNLDAALPGGSMTGGFVDQLLRVRSGMSRPPAYFGVAIERMSSVTQRITAPS